MLIGIDPILNADILHALRAMGHGDELVIADGSFPAQTVAKRLIRMEAADLPRMLTAVLSVMPVDGSEPDPVIGMEVIDEPDTIVAAHVAIQEALDALPGETVKLARIERFAFYDRAKEAFAVIATGETLFYGNVIIRKGTVNLGGNERAPVR
ncbi:RbsD/FucU family protein [Rhizobium ruizarguesonis]|uniref:RbsD/FucU family protein n=1 Tax=Rhizobium ruizarguesonis TaxID=2081791 RepID=UPI000425ECEF|nr:RbsD/FucU domain-containing protein [Rhizobium ruizarguesonis]MBY5851617.1 ribose ABC transporter [Rhizobium leguminosarum]NKL13380.1 ribose ABC transporter [Rhizobium leguminosarum bv. viciae]MBY5873380.1 ribose ABC transporter [Rhizobium leguminosarum]MBY5892398.1 ribose ABC transporter [Rhizobium leguminosarum]NEH38261.1 ribose ABC transporter [Rhizobium ruizarguesonis]